MKLTVAASQALVLPVSLEVKAEHQIVLARQTLLRLAEHCGFQRTAAYYVATAVSEMASNLVFHSLSGGTLQLGTLSAEGRWGLEVLAEDQGPGIADLELALQDGFSTRGGLGCGLGGIRRLMDGFEISSQPSGTRLRAWKWQPCR